MARLLAAGSLHSCALTGTGGAYCWGSNYAGEVGDGTVGGTRRRPTAVAGGVVFASITGGAEHTCALTAAGVAYCWGDNTDGQLGDGTHVDRAAPTPVAGGLTFTQIVAGDSHTCGLTTAGAAYCWGSDGIGQLGDGSAPPPLGARPSRTLPGRVVGGLTFTSLTAGGGFTCALTGAGALYCWGANDFGQHARSGAVFNSTPAAAVGVPPLASITAGAVHVCGLTSAGVAYCWGGNGSGQLGDGTASYYGRSTAAPVLGGLTFASLDAGTLHTCGVTTSGVGYCWGENSFHQLGDGGQTTRFQPTRVAGDVSFARIAAGGYHSCGVAVDGAVYCWGANDDDQLGLDAVGGSGAPMRVPNASP
jgi:alpha-tubulin suppressor-like RCC1 family protein